MIRYYATFCSVCVFVAGLAFADAPAVLIQGGSYIPQYSDADVAGAVEVASFELDRYPVTNARYLEFVRAKPQWSKTQIPSIFADAKYLNHWMADDTLGDKAPSDAPVVAVSWFAAREFCAWDGKVLPTVDQWEYAARADEHGPEATDQFAFQNRILAWYSLPTERPLPSVTTGFQNYWGAQGLHGLVWEWVEDFNTNLITGESRGDEAIDRQLYCAGGNVGATDFTDYAAFMRFAMRNSLKANYTVDNVGFRCAKGVTP